MKACTWTRSATTSVCSKSLWSVICIQRRHILMEIFVLASQGRPSMVETSGVEMHLPTLRTCRAKLGRQSCCRMSWEGKLRWARFSPDWWEELCWHQNPYGRETFGTILFKYKSKPSRFMRTVVEFPVSHPGCTRIWGKAALLARELLCNWRKRQVKQLSTMWKGTQWCVLRQLYAPCCRQTTSAGIMRRREVNMHKIFKVLAQPLQARTKLTTQKFTITTAHKIKSQLAIHQQFTLQSTIPEW